MWTLSRANRALAPRVTAAAIQDEAAVLPVLVRHLLHAAADHLEILEPRRVAFALVDLDALDTAAAGGVVQLGVRTAPAPDAPEFEVRKVRSNSQLQPALSRKVTVSRVSTELGLPPGPRPAVASRPG